MAKAAAAQAVKEEVKPASTSGQHQVFTLAQLRGRYNEMTAEAVAECELATELVGGQPAQIEGVRAFVKHHLKLEGAAAEEAVNRITREEIGEREVPSETGELKERLAYSINVIRRDAYGPYLGNWMAKACLKGAASRVGLFMAKRGTKGDLAEMGYLVATGISLLDAKHPERIYLRDETSMAPAKTDFDTFRGRVQTQQGSKSIVNDVECAEVGSRFAFSYRFYPKRLKMEDVADIFSAAMIIGLGSAKSFERGKFSITKLVVDGIR